MLLDPPTDHRAGGGDALPNLQCLYLEANDCRALGDAVDPSLQHLRLRALHLEFPSHPLANAAVGRVVLRKLYSFYLPRIAGRMAPSIGAKILKNPPPC